VKVAPRLRARVITFIGTRLGSCMVGLKYLCKKEACFFYGYNTFCHLLNGYSAKFLLRKRTYIKNINP
jgi:hypothetical protein